MSLLKALFSALLTVAASVDAFALMTTPAKIGTGKENSGFQRVVLRGQETCADKSVAKGSLEALVRRHTVRLLLNGNHHCTGTIVKRNQVVTAAHCLEAGHPVSDYTVQVYIEDQGYKEIVVEKFTRSTSQSRPDIGLLQLETPVPEVNVIAPASLPCDKREFVQAGFGLTHLGKPGACVRTASYSRARPPRDLYEITVPLAMDSVFFGIPKAKKSIGCNGDSGGPTFCKVKGRWSYAGIFLAIVAKEEDDREWQSAQRICGNYEHPQRLANCIRSCELSHGVAGYWARKIKSNLEEMDRVLNSGYSE